MTAAPRLETDRLVLRAQRMQDFPSVAAFYETEASRFVGGPLAVRPLWYGFGAEVGAWELMGFGAWAVEERASGAFAGQVMLNRAPDFPEAELAWILMPGFEGRGYAAEAARAARAWAYAALGWTTLVSYIHPANLRSIALARRLGCVEDADATPADPGDVVFRHPAPEALQ